MTIKELSQLYWLNKEIAQHEERLEALYAKASCTTPVLTGMPRAPGVSDRVGRYAVDIAHWQERLEDAKLRRIEERDRLMAYIETILDSQMRQIFMMRFVDGQTWDHIAEVLGSTPGSVKRRVFRKIAE